MKWSTLAAAGLLVVAVLVIYWPAIHGGFLFDDDALVGDNALAQSSAGLSRVWFSTEPVDYWPVTNTSFWVEWRLWGTRPTGYHVTNLLLHAACALLLWRLFWQLGVPGAFWGALLFAVHPVNVQSVAWIAQRKNTLSLLFFLLAILWFLKNERVHDPRRRPADRWYWLSLGAFVCAMLSKGSVAVLPGILLLLAWWQRRRVERVDLIRVAPFFAIASVFTAVDLWFQARAAEPIRDVSFLDRILGAGGVVWFYLSKAVVPVRLMFMYPQWDVQAADLRWWLALAAAAAVTVLLWRYRRNPLARACLMGWAFFIVALVPVLGLADVYFMKYSLVANHYEYIALIAVTALAGAAIGLVRQPPLRAAVGVAVAAVLGASAWGQARLYADPEILYRATLEANPAAWSLHNNLGAVLIDRGRDEEAIVQLREGVRLNPRLAAAYDNLCLASLHLGRYDDAVRDCSAAVGTDPDQAMPHANLGVALMALGRLREAEPQLEAALGLAPDYAEAHYNLGHLLVLTGRPIQALPHIREVLRLMPDSAAAENELGLALAAAGDLAEAERAFREAVRLRPDFAEAHGNLAALLQRLGRSDEAAAEDGKAHAGGR